jgi:hypothetical protein
VRLGETGDDAMVEAPPGPRRGGGLDQDPKRQREDQDGGGSSHRRAPEWVTLRMPSASYRIDGQSTAIGTGRRGYLFTTSAAIDRITPGRPLAYEADCVKG